MLLKNYFGFRVAIIAITLNYAIGDSSYIPSNRTNIKQFALCFQRPNFFNYFNVEI